MSIISDPTVSDLTISQPITSQPITSDPITSDQTTLFNVNNQQKIRSIFYSGRHYQSYLMCYRRDRVTHSNINGGINNDLHSNIFGVMYFSHQTKMSLEKLHIKRFLAALTEQQSKLFCFYSNPLFDFHVLPLIMNYVQSKDDLKVECIDRWHSSPFAVHTGRHMPIDGLD